MITKLTVRAFKGLREFSIEPRRMNLLIGANGTGKTNFVDLIAFIASLPRRGLPETIAQLGGLLQVRTRQAKGAPFKLHVDLQLGRDRLRDVEEAYYSFTLEQSKEIKVQEEELRAFVYEPTELRQGERTLINLSYQRQGTSITNWSLAMEPPGFRIWPRRERHAQDPNNISGSIMPELEDDHELVLSSPYGRRLGVLRNYLSSFRIYNLDSVIARQSSFNDERDLRRDGSNLIAFVANMLHNTNLRHQLLKDLQEVVPYIQDIREERLLTLQTLRFTERDTGTIVQFPEMSDGTIRLLGLLAILRQPNPPPLIVIEEPENALHAYAIHYILKVARQIAMSEQYPIQIFLTTHSPTVVDEVLSLEAMRETNNETACFITQRKPGEPSIVPAPETVMQAIARNLGRPSDFQREGSFGDDPAQPELPPALSEVGE